MQNFFEVKPEFLRNLEKRETTCIALTKRKRLVHFANKLDIIVTLNPQRIIYMTSPLSINVLSGLFFF